MLGVGPWDKWLQIDPQLTFSVNIDTLSLPVVHPSPVFEFRALFVNDEDLFGSWTNSPAGLSVWSESQWDL